MRHWSYVLFLSTVCLSTAIGCSGSDPIGGPDASGTSDAAKDNSSDGTVPGRDGAADSARDAAGDATTSCPTGQAACGTVCVDLQSSTMNCGACGTTCASAEVCSRGMCTSTCVNGTTKCGDVCEDLQSDPDNCGACGTKCTTAQVCSAGTCALTCSPGLASCRSGDAGAGTCVNTSNDRFNCGACGMTCAAGNVCGNGACAVSCPGAQINCGGSCVDPITSRSNCGATNGCGVGGTGSAGTACIAGNVCANGTCAVSCPGNQINCGGTCVDADTSRLNCGATAGCGVGGTGSAGTACTTGNVCSGGTCALSCAGSQVNCGGTCINPQTDRGYCGAFGSCNGANDGTVCAAGQVCSAGTCSLSCAGNQINCNGTCVDPSTDRAYCGASGTCTGANDGNACPAGQVCGAGTCAISCPGSQINCGGTCVNPQTDRGYCGASGTCTGANDGTACAAGQVCSAGTCAVSCPGNQINCNGTCVDALTDRGYCGASGDCTGANDGTACASGEVCSLGACQLSCPINRVECGGNCVDPLTNRGFCGASGDCTGANDGNVCPAGEVCSAGLCQVSCGGTQINCGGNCIQPASDRDFCGATGNCQGANDGTSCPAGEVCNTGSCSTSCPVGQVNCNGTCIVAATDRAYCGATLGCGVTGGSAGTNCGTTGQVCVASTCTNSCPTGSVNCGGTCVNPQTDRTFCGATANCASVGTDCAALGQVCSAGSCAIACPPGSVKCGGTCVNPLTDRTFCGASGDCDSVATPPGTEGANCAPSGQVCVTGLCAVTCPTGQVDCGGVCINPATDATHCAATAGCGAGGVGSSGSICSSTVGSGALCTGSTCACPSGQVSCSGACIDPTSNRTFCGASGVCTTGAGSAGTDGINCALDGRVCVGSACAVTCPGTQIECGGVCVEPSTDGSHCGATAGCGAGGIGSSGSICSSTVGSGALCTGSTCACPSGQVDCGSACIDPTSNRNFCGAAGLCTPGAGSAGTDGIDCALDGRLCVGSACAVTCPGTQINCVGICVEPSSDETYCGASGLCGAGGGSIGVNCVGTIGTGALCTGSTCACPSGQVDCGSACIDPDSNRTYCGASGICTPGVGPTGTDGIDCSLDGRICVGGSCAVTCPGNQIECGGVCIDPSTDATYCGASGACTPGAGSAGTDGVVCGTFVGTGALCTGSTCACPGGQIVCGSACIDPTSNRTFCGATGDCSVAAPPGLPGIDCSLDGRICIGGSCAVTCPDPQVECGGVCINPTTNAAHCAATNGCGLAGGVPGADCSLTIGAGAVCTASSCGCPSDQIDCGSACIDRTSNRNFCGATGDCSNIGSGNSAGNDCSLTDRFCVGASCAATCPSGQIDCGGVCIDPTTNAAHCAATNGCGIGGAGGVPGADCIAAIGAGAVCTASTCSCPGGQIDCGSACIDRTSNRSFCGATGDCTNAGIGNSDGEDCALTGGRFCVDALCAAACPTGQIDCGGVCIDRLTDETYCGATVGCGGPAGGSIGLACAGAVGAGAQCTGGACSCPGTQIVCDGTCIDPATDRTNCGATGDCSNVGVGNSDGTDCAPAGQLCVASSCAATCPTGQFDCGGVCINPTTNATYCNAHLGCGVTGGDDGDKCSSTVGTGAVCTGAACACPGGQIVCGGPALLAASMPAPSATCIDPTTNRRYCGATTGCGGVGGGIDGEDCTPSGRFCVGSACVAACPTGQIDCGGVCINPATDETYCGATAGCTAGAGPLGSDGINCTDDVGNGAQCNGSVCACPGSQISCGGNCIDRNTNNTFCGAQGLCDGTPGNGTGTPCASNAVCVGGSCLLLAQKVIFVTSTVYNGDLVTAAGNGIIDGLLAGDALCAARATAVSLTGTFKAWLSSDSVHARDRLTHFAGRYVLQDGVSVVANNWTDLVDRSILHAINQTELGSAPVGGSSNTACSGGVNAMTGTDGNGLMYGGNTCNGWTMSAGDDHALGDTSLTGQEWTELGCWNDCSFTAPIYCIEQ